MSPVISRSGLSIHSERVRYSCLYARMLPGLRSLHQRLFHGLVFSLALGIDSAPQILDHVGRLSAGLVQGQVADRANRDPPRPAIRQRALADETLGSSRAGAKNR